MKVKGNLTFARPVTVLLKVCRQKAPSLEVKQVCAAIFQLLPTHYPSPRPVVVWAILQTFLFFEERQRLARATKGSTFIRYQTTSTDADASAATSKGAPFAVQGRGRFSVSAEQVLYFVQ